MTTSPNTAKITLGGKEFTVPQLPIRVQRIVVPGLMKLGPVMMGAKNDPSLITTEVFDQLVDLLHAGLSHADKDFTKDQLLDLPATQAEFNAAFLAIGRQAGLTVPEPGKVGVPGEAPATPKPPTSTP